MFLRCYLLFQTIKGFAFIEFDKPESMLNALKVSAAEKRKLRPDMDPSELLSIKTFIIEQQQQQQQPSPDKQVSFKGRPLASNLSFKCRV
jgi:hypothetical protein